MQFRNLQVTNSVIKIDVEAAANNPCFRGSPDIDYEGTITVDVPAREVAFEGLVDQFPAFEMYARALPTGAMATLFQSMPLPGKTPANLPGRANRPQSGRVKI
jgi:hypothetical protein